MQGVWQSEGYGNVYAIQGSTLRAFEVTTATCVLAFSAQKVSSKTRQDTFKRRGGSLLLFTAEAGNDRGVLTLPGMLSTIAIKRLPGMPSVCVSLAPNTPAANFDVFTRTFSEQYIGIALRNTPWPDLVANSRRQVTDRTTAPELFQIFESLLAQFADLHTAIEAPSLKRESRPFFVTIPAGSSRATSTGSRARAAALSSR